MAELYERYESLFLQGNDFRCDLVSECGIRFSALDRNFLHLVHLRKKDVPEGDKLNIQVEKPIFRETKDGFGDYFFEDPRRAKHMAAALDTLLRPHAVFRVPQPKTAHLAFFKHYGDKPDPVMMTFVGTSESDGCLVPFTCFPSRLRRARKHYQDWDGGAIWRFGDPPLEKEP